MDSFQHFLQLRGIKRVRRQHNHHHNHHRLSSGSVRSRATSDGNIRINTIVSNIRNENEVQASSSISRSNSDGSNYSSISGSGIGTGRGSRSNSIVIIEDDEPLGIIQINNNAVSSHDEDDEDEVDDFDSFYNTRSGSFGGTVSSSTSDDIDRSFEYITSGSPCHTMSCVNEDGDDEVDRFSFNVESKDFNDDMGYPMMMDHSDFAKILRVSPSDNFTNSLMVNHFGIKKLFAEDFRKFKNNLSEIVTDGDSEWLVLALNAELVFFGFDGLTNLPSRQILRLDTSPSYTSSTDRLISTWPYFPHTINYLKSGVFNGKHVLAACTDDGTLLIWYSQRIIELVSKFESKIKSESDNNTPTAATTTNTNTTNNNNNNSSVTTVSSSTVIKPDFRMKMEASLWGLDFKTYNGHNIIVASDNSQSVVLFYYHPIDERFYHIRSHQILHNIPEVSIVSCVEDDNGEHTVDVSCCSISGEIIIFQFKFTIHQGPVNLGEYEYFKNESYYYVDGTMEQLENRNGIDPHELAIWKSKKFKRIEFSDAVCISRIVLSEDCWTIKPLDSKWFLPVGSIRDIFGDSKIDNTKELNRINQESKTLGQSSGKFQYFPSKTVNLEQQPQQQEENEERHTPPSSSTTTHTKLTSIDDEYRRIHKELIRGSSRYLLVSSTARKLALFNFPSLYCPCSTEKVFNLAIPFNEESKFTNRISITKIIPELSCLIAVTQQGLITIMRLCTFNGIYGMRQEHVFPNALSLSLGYHGYRTIVGICLRDRSLDRPCFAILQPEEIQRKQQQHLTTHKRKKKKKRLRRRKKLNVAQDLFIDDGLSSDEGIPFESLITSRTKRNSKRVVSHESLTVDECPDISLNHTLMDFQKTPVEIKHVKNYLSYDDDGSLFMNSKHGREINSTTVRETTLEEGTNDIPFHANHSLSLMVSDHGHWNKQTIAFNENGGTFMNRDYYKVASLFNCQMGIFGSFR
ncbi:hypothetical protein G210_1418 [Candida maltosa Xu316]|uniref:Uncharacterized protein n=1 Tax=Candida maltosa (strain Xu316) TaxID=1245528 RepID=M3K097_CANMX|nr:hypothetical protein G210_1418 [Candida maltosa Xu316]